MTAVSDDRPGPSYPADATEAERTAWCNIIANMRVLTGARDDTVREILGHAVFRRHVAGEVIVLAAATAGEVFFLVEGVVRAYQEKGSVQYTAKLLTAPAHFGELALLAGFSTYRTSIEAVQPSLTAVVPFALLERLLAADANLARAWLYSLARQFSVTIDFLRQTVFGGVAAQLANVLLSYSQAFGRDAGEGWLEIAHELSYADLARQAACTRRAAILAMQAFTEAEVVRRVGEYWQIRPQPLGEGLLPGRLSLTHSQTDGRVPEE